MRKFLIFLLALMMIGAASGLPMFGPAQGFKNPGTVELGALSIDGVDINGGDISYDDFVIEFYTNETAINNSIDALRTSAYLNETEINNSISSLTGSAYLNETEINSTLAAMPGSIVNTEYGLKNLSGDIIVNLTTNDGLEFGTGATLGALGVKTGDGLDTGATGVLVDVTDIIYTAEGLYEQGTNNIAINLTEDGGLAFGTGADTGALIIYPYYGLKTTSNGLEVNLTANKGLEFGTGAAQDSLQIKLDGSTLSLGSSGIKVTDNTFADKDDSYTNETAIIEAAYVNETAINNSISALTEAAYINETAINASIDALVVPLATFAYDANSVDQGVFTASGGWVLTAVKMTPRVVGSDGEAVTVMVKICDSGEAPASGDNMLSGTLDLKTGADVPQSGTVSSGAIADGKIVALDFTGTLTSAVGTITLYGTRA